MKKLLIIMIFSNLIFAENNQKIEKSTFNKIFKNRKINSFNEKNEIKKIISENKNLMAPNVKSFEIKNIKKIYENQIEVEITRKIVNLNEDEIKKLANKTYSEKYGLLENKILFSRNERLKREKIKENIFKNIYKEKIKNSKNVTEINDTLIFFKENDNKYYLSEPLIMVVTSLDEQLKNFLGKEFYEKDVIDIYKNEISKKNYTQQEREELVQNLINNVLVMKYSDFEFSNELDFSKNDFDFNLDMIIPIKTGKTIEQTTLEITKEINDKTEKQFKEKYKFSIKDFYNKNMDISKKEMILNDIDMLKIVNAEKIISKLERATLKNNALNYKYFRKNNNWEIIRKNKNETIMEYYKF